MTSTIERPTGAEAAEPGAEPTSKLAAGLAGLLASGVALAVAELLSGLTRDVPSLVIAVGTWIVDNGFQELDNWARETFGTGQKSALVTDTVVTTLVLGVVTGIASRRRAAAGVVVFGGFAVVGSLAGMRDPQATDAGAWIAGVLSGAAGIATLLILLRLAERRSPARNDLSPLGTTVSERRWFLGAAGGAAFVAIFGSRLGKVLRSRRDVEEARTTLAATLPAEDPTVALTSLQTFDEVPGLSPFITPNDDFYRIDTALSTPLVDPTGWTLRVRGLVDDPYEITFDELLDLPTFDAPVTLSCVSNEVGGNLVGNAIWTGVPLTEILDRAGVADDATQIVGRSVDGWTAGFPTEVAYDGRTAMVAFAMNGEPLPVAHGFPARLVVAGLYGYVSATKWLKEIELTRWEDFDGYWIPRGWAKEGPVKTQSRIDVPRGGARVPPGPTAVAGIAWAPTRSIVGVEVRIDEGPWQPTDLSEELASTSWRQWLYTWDATPGEHRIQVRATDGTGFTQTERRVSPRPDGAEGWDEHMVRVEEA